MAQPTLRIGACNVAEIPFVAHATKHWLRNSPKYAQMSNYDAFGEINPLVNRLLAVSEVYVAREGNTALGFTIVERVEDVALLFVYVKHKVRRGGIGKDLLLAVLDRIPADCQLEGLFPCARFADLAEKYGIYLPESL